MKGVGRGGFKIDNIWVDPNPHVKPAPTGVIFLLLLLRLSVTTYWLLPFHIHYELSCRSYHFRWYYGVE